MICYNVYSCALTAVQHIKLPFAILSFIGHIHLVVDIQVTFNALSRNQNIQCHEAVPNIRRTG